ncbi:YdaS family helix-turn-helix protein [Curvibacter lanceolatus]|uniref:YdaS family helix-turn-helix protein n=1 Tax=Curvibacter lanceolatus TaxID=86182 RepID=UPI0012FC6316|nr:YdaS family helix-turn-helix protein [Curvibacter lanceolatus]
MNILDTAIQAEGGVGNLAKALGIGQSNVSNWRGRGIPRGWQTVLLDRYGPNKTQAADGKKRRARTQQTIGA